METTITVWSDIVKCAGYACRAYADRQRCLVYDDEFYCKDCERYEFRVCNSCEETVQTDHSVVDAHGDAWCDSCRDEYVSYCDRCSEFYNNRYAYFYDMGYETWCGECAADYAYWCEYCDEYSLEECDMHSTQDGDLLPYDYKPMPIFHGSPDNGLYLGLELECEDISGSSISDAVDYIRQAWDGERHLYCKHDGSLSDGMEIVSHPTSLEEWQGSGQKLHELTDRLKSMGFRSWDTQTCGIHIHVSASAFDNDVHLYKFSQMFYKNPERMQRFAGRGSTTYAEYSEGRLVYETLKRKKLEGGRAFSKRYTAVNLNNSNTVEVRIFRGTLNHERILANLELVHAAVEYTRQITCRDALDGALDFGVFRLWAARQGCYPHMMKLIRARVTKPEDSSTNMADPFARTA